VVDEQGQIAQNKVDQMPKRNITAMLAR
jgi:hypothetical protein